MLSKAREEEIYPRRELQQIYEDRVHTSATTLPEKAGEIQPAHTRPPSHNSAGIHTRPPSHMGSRKEGNGGDGVICPYEKDWARVGRATAGCIRMGVSLCCNSLSFAKQPY